MTPPIESFPASEVMSRVNTTAEGKLRKGWLDLDKCKPMQLMQFHCGVEDTAQGKIIRCNPTVRFFRK